MSIPGGVRFHYGHPDLWNKTWVMTRGGVSKATKCVAWCPAAWWAAIIEAACTALRAGMHIAEVAEVAEVE